MKVCSLNDQAWYDGRYFYDALVTTGSECFNIPMVVENQTLDVHPPLYYIFLNLICSCFPGQFSKWYGIGLNIFFVLLVGVGLFLLFDFFLKKKCMSLIFSTIFCCSGLSVDMVLFIRMYTMLMACFLFSSWYHLLMYQWVSENVNFTWKKEWLKYLLLGILTIAGALTHYYFLVYQAMISVLFVLLLWKSNRIRQSLDYMITMIISGILYCCMYPSVFKHLFSGYRGKGAFHDFFEMSALFEDSFKMLQALNENFFRGYLFWLLGIMTAVTVVLVALKRASWKRLGKYLVLVMPSIIYFWIVSKASPYIVLRYVAPVVSFIYAFIILWMLLLFEGAGIGKARYVLVCVLMGLLVVFYPIRSVKGSYLQEREQVVKELAKECDYCVYISGSAYNWKMWEDYVIYPEFRGLFYIDGVKKSKIIDEKLLNQKDLTIFIDKSLHQSKTISWLEEAFPEMEFEMQYEEAPYVNIVYMHARDF